MKACILGEGAWGTAVATLLAENGHTVHLWCYHKEVAEEIEKTGYNSRFLPGVHLSERIIPFTSMKEAVCTVPFVFEAIPVTFLRSVLEQAAECFTRDQTWVVLSKGIEEGTLQVPSQIIEDVYGKDVKIAVFTGPSFARDLAEKQVTAVTIAARNCTIGNHIEALLANEYFRPYLTLDTMGVQIGGAVKNVVALGVGLLDGAGYTDNAKAFFFTRGLHEMMQIAVAMGGKRETLYGLSGVGDLVLTAMGSKSRNVKVGRKIGQGATLQELSDLDITAEGVATAHSVNAIAKKFDLNLPLCQGVYEVVTGKKEIQEVIQDLIHYPDIQECAR